MGQSELNRIHVADEDLCLEAGRNLVTAVLDNLPEGRAFVVHLSGELGAGKTTFARGMLRGAGIEGHIRSPTYTLVETYETAAVADAEKAVSAVEFVHIDLYRVSGTSEAEGLGLREYDRHGVIWLVEWPERVAVVRQADIDIALSYASPGREITLSGRTAAGRAAVAAATSAK